MKLFRINLITLYYLLAILISGLFYSYATTRIVSFTDVSPFFILVISGSIDILIFIDLVYLHKLSILSSRTLSIITSVFLILFFLISIFDASVFVLFSLFAFCAGMFAYHLRYYEEKIILTKKKMSLGLVNISLLQNISKLLGFGLGAYLYKITLQNYIVILICLFLLFAFVNVKEDQKIDLKYKLSLKKLNNKKNLLIMSLLSTTAVFWIPILVTEFNENNLIEFAAIPFVAPGIFTVAYLKYFHNKYPVTNNKKDVSLFYLILTITFFIIQLFGGFLILKIVLFSCIVPFIVAINISLNTEFMESNTDKTNNKVLLQIISVFSAIGTIILSFLAIYLNFIPYFILLLNMFVAIVVIYMKGSD